VRVPRRSSRSKLLLLKEKMTDIESSSARIRGRWKMSNDVLFQVPICSEFISFAAPANVVASLIPSMRKSGGQPPETGRPSSPPCGSSDKTGEGRGRSCVTLLHHRYRLAVARVAFQPARTPFHRLYIAPLFVPATSCGSIPHGAACCPSPHHS
jgi:hypothetical protein